MFSWKGEDRVVWNGMDVQRLRDGAAAQDGLATSCAGSDLMEAAAAGDVPKLIELLARGECVVNEQDHLGCTPLWHAVYHGQRDIVECLLQAGASAEVASRSCPAEGSRSCSIGGQTALHIAVARGSAARVPRPRDPAARHLARPARHGLPRWPRG